MGIMVNASQYFLKHIHKKLTYTYKLLNSHVNVNERTDGEGGRDG